MKTQIDSKLIYFCKNCKRYFLSTNPMLDYYNDCPYCVDANVDFLGYIHNDHKFKEVLYV